MRGFLQKAYRQPRVDEADVKRFVALVDEQRKTGLTFTDAMIAGYTAVLASPKFVYLNEKPGKLDDWSLATRLSLFLWNSLPDEELRSRAAKGDLTKPAVLRAETERMLADPKSRRFVDAFLDYWIDLRKMEDSTPSTSLYNDYYLDDALTEAATAESQLYFEEMLRRNLPVREVVDSKFTFLNERLAVHYGVPGVQGVAMRKVDLPADSAARWLHDAGERSEGDGQWNHDVAGAAREVDHGADSGVRDSAASGGACRRARYPGRGDDPAAARKTPRQCQLRHLSQ